MSVRSMMELVELSLKAVAVRVFALMNCEGGKKPGTVQHVLPFKLKIKINTT